MTGISGIEQLDEMIATIRAIPGPEYVVAARGVIDRFLQGTTAAGTTPDGQAWKPRVRDGGKALKNAYNAITVRVAGRSVVVRLTGHHVFHHFSTQGREARQIIPVDGMPAQLGNAIRQGMVEPFEAKTRAGKRGYAYIQARAAGSR